MSKLKHTYSKNINLELEYTYDKEYNKVYNTKKVKKDLNYILNTLK
jgi:hypothetical protein